MRVFRARRPDDEGRRTDDSGTEHLLLRVTSARNPPLLRAFNVRPRIAASSNEMYRSMIRSSTVVPPVSHAILNEVTEFGGVTDGEDINPLLIG